MPKSPKSPRRQKWRTAPIYLYFQNKDDILISLFEVEMEKILRNMKARLSQVTDPIKKIELFAAAHLGLVEKSKELAEVIQVEIRQSIKFMKEYRNDKFIEYLNLIADIVRDGQEQGMFRKDVVPGIAKRAFFGALDEMSRYWVLSTRRNYSPQNRSRTDQPYLRHRTDFGSR